MPFLNEIFFFAFAAITFVMLFSGVALFKRAGYQHGSATWLYAIFFHGLAFLCFALASTIHLSLLSFANTFLFLGYLNLAFFTCSLNNWLPRRAELLTLFMGLAFLVIFEYLRLNATFVDRVSFAIAGFLGCILFALIQIYKGKKEGSLQFNLLIFGLVVQSSLLITRLIYLYIEDAPLDKTIYKESPLVTAIRWTWLAGSIFWYAPIMAIFSEKFLHSKNIADVESDRVKLLLKEKELLVFNALKLNKTTSTGALTASLAHELNQPIAAIGLNIESLKISLERGSQDSQFQLEILNALKEDAQHASQIISSLRNIFIDKKNVPVSVSVKEVVDGTLVHISPALKAAGIKVLMDIDNHCSIQANPAEIEQVLLNLLNNAIHALSAPDQRHPFISIEVFRVGDCVHLTISDNGPGISSDLMPHLFNLFTSNKKNGMGLGLWLCQYIVTRNQGSIHCEDTKSGAKFVVIFPDPA